MKDATTPPKSDTKMEQTPAPKADKPEVTPTPKPETKPGDKKDNDKKP
jgi:hypothetical protein